MTDTTLPTRTSRMHRINGDPRVTASREAFEAFMESEHGALLNAAASSHDHEAEMAMVDDGTRERYEAHAVNHTITRRRVRLDLAGQPVPSYTDLADNL